MSRKDSFKSDVHAANEKLGGGLRTREAREGALERFGDWLWSNNFKVERLDSVKLKHITAYIAHLQGKNTARTVQNAVSHLRQVLTAAGREKFVREQLRSSQLKLESASRDGTKVAIPDAVYEKALSIAQGRDEGVAAAMMLSRALGLRSLEAVMSATALKAWERALMQGLAGLPAQIVVAAGTKGGRMRTLPVSQIPQPERALAAVQFALEIAARQNGQVVVGCNLKSALDHFHNEARRAGLVGVHAPHSMRYAFACEALDRYKAEIKLPARQAEKLAASYVSLLLGHGDGRGRWVMQVYSRGGTSRC